MAKLFDFTLDDLHEALNNQELRDEFEVDHEEAGVREYLDHALVLGDAGRESLNYVVENGDTEDTEIFLAIRNEEEQFEGGITYEEVCRALFNVSEPGQIDVLMDHGADIDTAISHLTYGDAWTPVSAAIDDRRPEVAIKFIEEGAATFGSPAMGLAIENNLLSVALALDEHTLGGAFPLHTAIEFENHEMINALLEAGVDPYKQDGNDQNAFDIASEYAPNCLEVLANAQAKELQAAWSPSQADADALMPQATGEQQAQHQQRSRRL
ncbi:ankyrin repeat domain-containing protein [Novilysobacter arseniciresistens]|uniref:ankyrin repeat domain-containing protein n=1 Tax=Novilysobacter arseniciresistens TaxID=1385522 RepID=UPI0009E005FC|nr:ankyrin repeat domain-containing protein [Lysobacter arseniciresistens]